jgi:hypothetical protein
MATVNRLCQSCFLLDSGRIVASGDAPSVTARYLVSDAGTSAMREWADAKARPGDDVARLIRVWVKQNDAVTDTVDIRHPVEIGMTYEVLKDDVNLLSSFSFFDAQGVFLFVTGDFNDTDWSATRSAGIYTAICRVPGNVLSETVIRVVAEVATRHPVYQLHVLEYDSVGFQVVDQGLSGSVRGQWGGALGGVMRIMCDWTTSKDSEAAITRSGRALTP